jgi:hypothetical protein
MDIVDKQFVHQLNNIQLHRLNTKLDHMIFLNMNKALNFITENNIQPEALFSLVEKVRTMDLSDEISIRKVIKEVSTLVNKPIDKAKENKIVREILKNGINDNLFNMI